MYDFIFWDGENFREFDFQDVYGGEFDDCTHITESDTFQYIGKKDVNDKKIYADSSIVEFDFVDIQSVKLDTIKMIGVFTFCEEELRYELDILDWEKDKSKSFFSVLSYNIDKMKNFKIIDTIQENKLGLVK